ncbi:MAG TPA: divalent-cation tolerance protein CutA [Solibacterales bacterium]|nr:divalent-cation tolerance protein CutA [Bryobacterales bacterium]
MTDKIVVFTTCNKPEEAEQIAHALVEARLAACVNIIGPLRSVYRWKGAVEKDTEYLLIVKTSRALLDELKAELRRLHSYEVPEVLALPVVDGSESYLAWMEQSLRDAV